MSAPLLDKPSALPEDAVPALVDLIVALADNKHALGLRYSEWCTCGPTIEAGVSATAMAQDELGHARVLYGMLEELPAAPHRSEHEWAPGDARTVESLRQPFSSWPHLIVANVLLDGTFGCVLETALESRYLPLRQRARKLIEEEQFHAIHGRGWLRQLAAEGPAVRAQVEAIIRQAWPDALCWFGPDAGGALGPLVRAGVLQEAGEAVRQRFLRSVGPLFRAAALAVPLQLEGDRWRLTEPLPWSDWDEPRRRVRHG